MSLSYLNDLKLSGKIKKILVTGSNGQLGLGLIPCLNKLYGEKNIMCASIEKTPLSKDVKQYKQLDVSDEKKFHKIVDSFKPDLLIHMAAILSANGEKKPDLCYSTNVTGAKIAIDACLKNKVRLFVPSTIAAFGPTSPLTLSPNQCIQKPLTMYGCSKVFNEMLGNYYSVKHGLDFRSLRYPQVISNTPPGGGSGDCFVEIYYKAIEQGKFCSFLNKNHSLPLIYIDDLIFGTLQYLETDNSKLSDTVYNIQGDSFTIEQCAAEIRKILPKMELTCKEDFRQEIVEGWPRALDDQIARRDWGWNPKYTRKEMTEVMLKLIKENK